MPSPIPPAGPLEPSAAQRVEALARYAILDTPPEAGFDDLALAAAEVCAAPMALVSFLASDRQWFKARIGFEARETGLDRAICAHTLAADDLLVIPDLAADPRTAANPSVSGAPHLRFYAGAALRTPEGVGLGSLCVLDTAPRPEGLRPGQAEVLRGLGRQVNAQLDLRLLRTAERETEREADILDSRRVRVEESALLMRLAIDATDIGIWDYDLVRGRLDWDGRTRTLFGLGQGEPVSHAGTFLPRLHPADRAGVEAALQAAVDPEGPGVLDTEYRVRAGTAERWLAARGRLVVAGGRATRIVGTVRDVTARNEAEARFRRLFEGANVGMLLLDPHSLTVQEVNPKLCAIWGAPPEDIVGHSVGRWTPEDDAEERDRLHRRLAAGEIMQETLEKRYRRADGRIIWARVNLVSQRRGSALQITAMIEDITRERVAETRRRALLELGDVLRDAATRAAALAAATETAGRVLGADRAGFAAVDVRGGVSLATLREGADPALPPPEGLALPATVARLRAGLPLAVGDIAADPELAGEGAYARLGAGAVLAVPLAGRGRLAGFLFALADRPRPWTPGEIAFLREVAERLWGRLGRMQAEDEQSLRNRELSHRLKNTLAMAQAMVVQTLRNTPDLAAAREAVSARLGALGKAHDILLTGDADDTTLEAVIAGALAIHDDREPGRFRLGGPAVAVGSKAALALALTLHELATNAVKYGALSASDGRVAVAWRIEAGGDEPTLHIAWTERGGPPVVPPGRRGFGTRLIERGLTGAVGAAVSLDYAPEGLVCRIAAPLGALQPEI